MTNTSFETAVMPRFEDGRSRDWLERARNVALLMGREGGVVTIDMVRAICPPPPDADPRIMGAVMTRRLWERVGYESSVRATCHHRPVARFKLRTDV